MRSGFWKAAELYGVLDGFHMWPMMNLSNGSRELCMWPRGFWQVKWGRIVRSEVFLVVRQGRPFGGCRGFYILLVLRTMTVTILLVLIVLTINVKFPTVTLPGYRML